jgi:hypothetical protein
MEKRSGSIMAALLVGAGLMLHSSAGHSPSTAPGHRETASAAREEAHREGPWKASCQYWEPLRQNPSQMGSKQEANSPAAGSNAATSDCSATEWGLPDNIGQLQQRGLQAHAVIATVPDPVHSHLAPEFDRAMDALVGAASDNRYLRSYAWLPWKVLKEDASASTTGDDHAGEEPGLLVFDQRSTSGETPVILYMFLVAEMPGDGLNAEQLKKALKYELQLRSKLGAEFATDHAGNLRVIGPEYSGSAMSMIETVNGLRSNPSLNENTASPPNVVMAGTTQTEQAYRILNRCPTAEGAPCTPGKKHVQYVSFASGKAVPGMVALLDANGYDRMRAAVLREDGTFYGAVSAEHREMPSIAFPRDISLLRNSQKESGGGASDAGAPSPYLRLSTHDEGSQDTLAHLSSDISPLSQEAQLMSISHMLTQLHADFAYITASNPMDTLFLAKSLHRSNPDTRLVLEPDLLLQREGDDEPYIGSLSITPYPLVWLARSPELPGRLRAFASGQMEAYYNSASFTLGEMARSPETTKAAGPPRPPILYGYRGDSSGGGSPVATTPKLWLTTAGNDGYYPVAMLDTASGLPAEPQAKAETAITVHPSHAWQALCALVGLGCLLHIVAICSASYASPQTCDLDLQENCMQHRRALYAQVGGAALFLLSVAVALPATVFVGRHAAARLDPANLMVALVILLLAISEWLVAIVKTFQALWWESDDTTSLFQQSEVRVCAVLYWGAILATLGLAAMWLVLCLRHGGGQRLGAFFSYRCLHPLSGVSPLAPAVLLLWGWFFWALLHAKRLRLAMNSRPRLPDAANFENDPCLRDHRLQPDMFVSDARMQSGLLQDATCLMISRRVLHRIFHAQRAPRTKLLDAVLMLFLGALTVLWIGLCPIHALDHFGARTGRTTLYELFIGLLLVPLLLIAMCAAARLFLISASLRAHLLEPLERMPVRHAFTRLQGFHWVSMLRESGQLERWRDMSRSTEGIRQILNDPELPEACRTGKLAEQKQALEAEIAALQQHVRALREYGPQPDAPKRACQYMEEIEKQYAACSESILCCILLPHWLTKRHNLMQSTGECAENEPNVVLLAEEFLAVRYVAFIRAVLAQMRYLLLFITVGLVLVMLAINSYPFQPKQEIAWVVTGLFLAFSVGIIVVLAQMHRNPLLSRITDKEAHELGATFYLRVAGFGAVPLITWLATQYPSIGGLLYSVVKPGLDVMK